ncbi:hypothetical protein ACQ4PT_003491 [Festuca glaucescens]
MATSRWSEIAARLPGRTDNDMKNFWHSIIKKKLRRSGIDPATHKPVTEGSSNRATAATATAATLKAEFGEAGHHLANVPPQAMAESYLYVQSSNMDDAASAGAQASVVDHGSCSNISMAPLGYTQFGDFTGYLELDTVHPPVIPVVSSSSSTVCSMAAVSSAGTVGTSATVEQWNNNQLWLEPGWMDTFTDAAADNYGAGAGVTLDDLKWSDCVFDARYQLRDEGIIPQGQCIYSARH